MILNASKLILIRFFCLKGFKMKKSVSFLLSTAMIALSTSCAPPTSTPSTLSLQSIIMTKILPEKTTVSTRLKWSDVWGAKYYEIARSQDGAKEIEVSSNLTTSAFNDENLKEGSTYKYTVRAIDGNNRLVSQSQTTELKSISSVELKEPEIKDLKSRPETNTVDRLATLSWSSVAGADLYYASITNKVNNKPIFGVYTKDTNINININASPEKPLDLLALEMPVLINGMEKDIKHAFAIYTIKFDNKEKPTSIAVKKSQEFDLIL